MHNLKQEQCTKKNVLKLVVYVTYNDKTSNKMIIYTIKMFNVTLHNSLSTKLPYYDV